MIDNVNGGGPPKGPTLKIRLRSRMELDQNVDWRAGLFRSFGNTLSHGVALSTQEKPIAFTDVGEREAGWLAARLNRAAYLESALISMIASIVNYANAHPVALLMPAEVVARLAELYNETLAPGQRGAASPPAANEGGPPS